MENLQPVFDEAIESRLELLGPTVNKLMDVIAGLPCAGDYRHSVRLALTEALSNAIVHGNREDPARRVKIGVGCTADDQLVLSVTDEGEGFDPASVPDPTDAANLYFSHGRGIYLMRRLMDRTEHRLGGRQVVLFKRLSRKRRVDAA